MKLCVTAPPPALHNVWVKPSTILANVLWEIGGTGGYPIIDFTAEYRLKPTPGHEPESWKPIIPTHIPPNAVRFLCRRIYSIQLSISIHTNIFMK